MATKNPIQFKYDKTGHWMVQHQGPALLRVAGFGPALACKSVQANLTLPAQTPDGLLEVQFAGRPRPDLVLVELCTYPDRRVMEQLLDDALLTYLDRRVVPEVVALIFHPKGNLEVEDSWTLSSPLGCSALTGRWRVVKLWELPVSPFLAADDPGVAALSLLARFDRPPEEVFRQVRDIVDRKARPEEHKNLLAVCEILAGLRYNAPELLAIFGGRNAMIESPVLQEYVREVVGEAVDKAVKEATANSTQSNILRFLSKRLGPVPADVQAALKPIQGKERLDELVDCAVDCPSYDAFRARLNP